MGSKDQTNLYERQKRPSHTGSITLVSGSGAKAKYRIRVSAGLDANGKRVQRSKTVTGTRQDAERVAAELQVEHGSIHRTQSSMKVDELLMRWQHAHRDIWAPGTIATNKTLVNQYLSTPLFGYGVDSLTPPDIRRFYDSLGPKLAPASIKRVHIVLRSAMSWGLAEGLTRTNPASGVRRLPSKTGKTAVPTMDGIKAMIEASDGWTGNLFAFALATGARRGELAALEWSHIDDVSTEHARVNLVQRVSAGQVVPGLKAADFRGMLVPADLVERVRSTSKCDVYVFGLGTSKPIDVNGLTARYKKARDAVMDDHPEMAGTTLHGLRHLCGSWMIANQASIPEVQQRLGHASPAVTMGVYAHALQKDDAAAADLFKGL